jgi:hypothetical protein
MPGEILLSTAYLPPAEYFSKIYNSDKVLIEGEENYIKQTYRNRCHILTPDGMLILSVPVLKGPYTKTPIKRARIDYSKRWQQIHLRAIISSYRSSPYFEFYFDTFSNVLLKNHEYLFDLNMELLSCIMDIIKIKREIVVTNAFRPVGNAACDYRYTISPKIESTYTTRKYYHAFGDGLPDHKLSIIDIIFNTGPDSIGYI